MRTQPVARCAASLGCLLLTSACGAPAVERPADVPALYPAPEGLAPSDMYAVKVIHGNRARESFVYISHCPKGSFKVDRVWPKLLDRTFSWTSFACTGPVAVEVTKLFGAPADGVTISPKSFRIGPESFDGRTARFVLPRPLYVSVRFHAPDNADEYGQVKHGFMLFADPPEEEPPRPGQAGVVQYGPNAAIHDARVIYFPPGVHDLTERFGLGGLPLRDGQTVYVAPGAFVYGTIDGLKTVNTRVIGRGVISGAKYGHKSIKGK
ncbi:MAG: hypothetical protein ACYS9X_29575, partial [Planctomycetota bacterium]